MNQQPLKKIPRELVPKGAVLCDFCTAKCCRYFALPIDTPKDSQDYDFIRWFLIHDRAGIFVDDGTWFLLVEADCKHLRTDNRCGIYLTRPEICREYTTDNCEYDDSHVYERYFETSEQFEEYTQALFNATPDNENFRSPRPEPFPILY